MSTLRLPFFNPQCNEITTHSFSSQWLLCSAMYTVIYSLRTTYRSTSGLSPPTLSFCHLLFVLTMNAQRIIQAFIEFELAGDSHENLTLQPRQRCDAQLHAASMDVSSQGAHACPT